MKDLEYEINYNTMEHLLGLSDNMTLDKLESYRDGVSEYLTKYTKLLDDYNKVIEVRKSGKPNESIEKVKKLFETTGFIEHYGSIAWVPDPKTYTYLELTNEVIVKTDKVIYTNNSEDPTMINSEHYFKVKLDSLDNWKISSKDEFIEELKNSNSIKLYNNLVELK